jgi:hypothetical protein
MTTEMNELVVTVKIPKRFYEDHIERGCEEGTIIKVLKNHYIIELTLSAYLDLESDADSHMDGGESFEFGMQWLVSSARATYNAIHRDVPGGFAKNAHLSSETRTSLNEMRFGQPTTKGN